MKRRQFLLGSSAGLSLMALPRLASATARPCPPPQVSVSGISTAQIGCGSSGAPDWWTPSNTPANTWVKIAGGATMPNSWQRGATVSDVGRAAGYSPSTGIYAYGGSTPDASGKRMFLFGGGHGDYFGNETYALNLNQAVPSWEMFKGRSPGPYSNSSLQRNFHGQYEADNNAGNSWPISHHNSGSVVVAGKYVTPQIWGVYRKDLPGAETSARFSLDLTTREWAKHGKTISDEALAALPSTAWGDWEACGTVAVPWLNEVWGGFVVSSQSAVCAYRWNVLTGKTSTWTLAQMPHRLLFKSCAVAVPPKGVRPGFVVSINNGRLVLSDPNGEVSSKPVVYGIAGADFPDAIPFNNETDFVLPRSGYDVTAALDYWPQGDSLVYSSPANNNGIVESFIRIKIPTGLTVADLAKATWTAKRFVPVNAGSGPESQIGPAGYLYRSLAVVPDMGDGDAAIVFTKASELFTSGLSAPVYALRLGVGT